MPVEMTGEGAKQGGDTFYLISRQTATYAGISNNPLRRLRQHNGEISGGARFCVQRGPGWKHEVMVTGFPDRSSALQFEWRFKHHGGIARGMKNRIQRLHDTLKIPKWHEMALSLRFQNPDWEAHFHTLSGSQGTGQ